MTVGVGRCIVRMRVLLVLHQLAMVIVKRSVATWLQRRPRNTKHKTLTGEAAPQDPHGGSEVVAVLADGSLWLPCEVPVTKTEPAARKRRIVLTPG